MPASISESTRGLREPESPNSGSVTRTDRGSTTDPEHLPRLPAPVATRDRDRDRRSLEPDAYRHSEGYNRVSPRATTSSGSIPEPLRSPSHISFGNEVDEGDVPRPYDHRLGLILVHMSSSSPLVALVLALYSLLATLILILLTPLRLCTHRPPFSQALHTTLAPALRFQMRLIVAAEPPFDEKRHLPSASKTFAACTLAPFVALCLLPIAWTVGVFWCFAAIIGDPTSRSGRETDGRAAVRSVRRWWEELLLWGVAEP